MNSDDYILRSLSRIAHKRWEHYAINRIFHRLDDPEIEFVCQQCVRKNDSKIYLTDLFFPQLGLYLEVDESQHQSDIAKINDAKRNFDIVEASRLKEVRIRAFGVSLDQLNASIEDFIQSLRHRKAELVKRGEFKAWDYARRFTAAPHIEAGFMEIGPHSAFRTHKDALNCFGYRKGHYQRAGWSLPDQVRSAVDLAGKSMVWFPHLYHHDHWENSLSEDGKEIVEKSKVSANSYREPWDQRIVMARSRDELNRVLYRFIGVFEIVPEFREGNEHRFRRVATRVQTYDANRMIEA